MKRLLPLIAILLVAASNETLSYFGCSVTVHQTDGKQVSRWLTVQETVKNGPAARAGLRGGDMIVAIDGQPLRFANEMEALRMLAEKTPGKKLTLTILRDRKKLQRTLTPLRMTAEQRTRWQAMMRAIEAAPKPRPGGWSERPPH